MFTRSLQRIAPRHVGTPIVRQYANPGQRLWAVENKGTAFTKAEREALRIRGLLPPAVEDIERQAERALLQFETTNDPMDKYNFLNRIKNSNETLFYYLLMHNLEAMCPIIYTPTVGQACQQYAQIFRTAEGMYFCQEDRGRMRDMLNNWPSDVSIIVVTDGSRILGKRVLTFLTCEGLGDLGANGMGIPIGKLALYTGCGGFHPQSTLPVMMDTGTNNQKYLNDPLYLGLKHHRLGNKEYYQMWEEFLMAVKDKWPNAIVQFEDISNDHCFELLRRYRGRLRCFNDDIQGTGAVVAAGFLGAAKMAEIPLRDHRIIFYGAGSAAVGVADQICTLISYETGESVEEIRKQFYLMDTRGLVTSTRGDKLEEHKLPYARSDMTKEYKTLAEALEDLKPTALMGLSGVGGSFTEDIIKAIGSQTNRPIIFALSNPTSNAECTAEQAYTLTDGRAIFASGSPFQPVTLNGKVFVPGQGNNMYIFPGLGLGAYLARSMISDGMVTTAAATLATMVKPSDLEQGRVYPAVSNIREISCAIATAVIQQSIKEGLSTADFPEGKPLKEYVRKHMYNPVYSVYSQ